MGAFAAVLAISAFAPAIASAQSNVVGDLLNGLLGGGQGGGGAAAPAGGSPGTGSGYQPPLHGTNPHGQGTVGVADLVPSSEAPMPSDPGDGDEDVVIGDTQGEQNADGSYHGRVTLLHANLLGVINLDDILGDFLTIETDEGETESGALQPLNDVLGQVCDASQGAGGKLCLNLLDMQSSTTSNGSTNSFEAAGADIALGPITAKANVANSNGNISDDGSCQTSSGDSSVASANVVGITADALQGSSSSTACQGSSSTTNDSEVLNIAGVGIPIPVGGCADGTANSEFTSLNPLLATVCNADETNGSQTGSPYGVREALAAFVLPIASAGGLVKVSAGGPESHAVAPTSSTPEPPTTNPPGDTSGDGGGGVKGGAGEGGAGGGAGDDGAGAGGGPASTAAQPGDGKLAFTGTNLIILAMIGAGLVLGGMVFSSMSGRGRRAAA